MDSIKNNKNKDGEYKSYRFSTTSIRKILLKEYEREVPMIVKIQTYRNKYLDFYFNLASILGEEVFFIMALPITCWLVSPKCAENLCVLLAMTIGGGNILKNTFTLPRPPQGIVWTNTAHQKDHGLPSTHTASAFGLSFYFWVFTTMTYPHIAESQIGISSWALFSMVLFWSLSVMFSRLYNGHHTPMDVTAGFILAIFSIVTFSTQIRYFLINLSLSSTFFFGPVIYLGILSTILFFHPQPKSGPTPAYPETGLVFGASMGSFLGSWVKNQYPIPPLGVDQIIGGNANSIVMLLNSNVYLLNIVRIVLGLVIVGLAKVLSKKFFFFAYDLAYRANTNNEQSQPITAVSFDPNKKLVVTPMIEAYSKLFVYSMVSFTITYLAPYIFYLLNIQTQVDLSTLL